MNDFNKWFRFNAKGGPPLVNVFILDYNGKLIADSFPDSRSVGMRFRKRLTSKCSSTRRSLMPCGAIPVIRSCQALNYKYVISTRIWGDDKGSVDDKSSKEPLGVLATGIPIDFG